MKVTASNFCMLGDGGPKNVAVFFPREILAHAKKLLNKLARHILCVGGVV